MKKMYETAMINHGGRVGEVVAPNGSLRLKVDQPGAKSEGTNPEQLFAAGYASCFNGALQHILKEHGVEAETEVKARVSLYQLDDGGFQIGVVIEAKVSGIDKSEAEKFVHEAHAFCPYSKATKGNIDVEVNVVE